MDGKDYIIVGGIVLAAALAAVIYGPQIAASLSSSSSTSSNQAGQLAEPNPGATGIIPPTDPVINMIPSASQNASIAFTGSSSLNPLNASTTYQPGTSGTSTLAQNAAHAAATSNFTTYVATNLQQQSLTQSQSVIDQQRAAYVNAAATAAQQFQQASSAGAQTAIASSNLINSLVSAVGPLSATEYQQVAYSNGNNATVPLYNAQGQIVGATAIGQASAGGPAQNLITNTPNYNVVGGTAYNASNVTAPVNQVVGYTGGNPVYAAGSSFQGAGEYILSNGSISYISTAAELAQNQGIVTANNAAAVAAQNQANTYTLTPSNLPASFPVQIVPGQTQQQQVGLTGGGSTSSQSTSTTTSTTTIPTSTTTIVSPQNVTGLSSSFISALAQPALGQIPHAIDNATLSITQPVQAAINQSNATQAARTTTSVNAPSSGGIFGAISGFIGGLFGGGTPSSNITSSSSGSNFLRTTTSSTTTTIPSTTTTIHPQPAFRVGPAI